MWTSRRRSATPPQTPSSARRAGACAHHSALRPPRPRRIGALARPQCTRHAHALLARVRASAESRLSDLPARMARVLRRAARSAVRVDAREESTTAPAMVLHTRRPPSGPATDALPGRLLTAGRVGLGTANRTFAECSPEHPGTFARTCCAWCANSCVTACAERCDRATRGPTETPCALVRQGLEPPPTLFLSPRSGTSLILGSHRLCAGGTGTSYGLLRCCCGPTVGIAPVLVGVGWLGRGCVPAGSVACGVPVRPGALSAVVSGARARPVWRRRARVWASAGRAPHVDLSCGAALGAGAPPHRPRGGMACHAGGAWRAWSARAPRAASAPTVALTAAPNGRPGVRLPAPIPARSRRPRPATRRSW